MNNFNLLDQISGFGLFSSIDEQKIINIIAGEKLIDMLFFLPKKCFEYILVEDFMGILKHYQNPNISLIILVEIIDIKILKNSKGLIIEARCYNATCNLIFLKFDRSIFSLYKKNTSVFVTGKIKIEDKKIIIFHPKYRGRDVSKIKFYSIENYYCSNKAKNRFIQKSIQKLVNHLNRFALVEDWIPEEVRKKYNIIEFWEAISHIHNCQAGNMDNIKFSYDRLTLDEIIVYQGILRQYKMNTSLYNSPNYAVIIEATIENVIRQLNISFKINPEQMAVLREIFYDILIKDSVYRLIHGDVGCGKTVIAVIVSFYMFQIGKQVAIVSPSITLARQHYKYYNDMIQNDNCVIELLCGDISSKSDKKLIYQSIKMGISSIVIGTHSIFNNECQFVNLGLIIFDEHHKFGVKQRGDFTFRNDAYVLSMTATPNPRTMMLVHYGFMDISTIKKVNNRNTFTIDIGKTDIVLKKIPCWINKGEKIYWICSRVEDTEQYFGCVSRFNSMLNIQEIAKNVKLIHGKMDWTQILDSLEDFRNNKAKVLISTTIVEVGIDIQDATIIIIENAEMFGMSQLHQLRGRVGRGTSPGKCLLMYDNSNLQSVARIERFAKLESGLDISDLDLELRGPGDIIGTNQKGKKNFKFINKTTGTFLFRLASDIAPFIKDNQFFKQALSIDEEQFYLRS